MYLRFKQDPYFLQKYNMACAVLLPLIALCVGFFYSEDQYKNIFLWLPITLFFGLSSFRSILYSTALAMGLYLYSENSETINNPLTYLGLIIAGIYVGVWSNVLIHNCSHKMIKPLWFNRIIGEFAALFLLSGFPSFAITHIEHHRHPDDLELDPHPNLPDMNLWQYINTTRARLRLTFKRMYLETWGNNNKYIKSLQKISYLLPLNRILRAILLLMILGPKGFTFFFLPAHITVQLVFATLNFYTHQRGEDGLVRIVNLDHNLAYKILNRGFAGPYFHKNHHLKPNLFNPMKLNEAEANIGLMNATTNLD